MRQQFKEHSHLNQHNTSHVKITSDLHFPLKPTTCDNFVCLCVGAVLIFCCNIEKEIIFFMQLQYCTLNRKFKNGNPTISINCINVTHCNQPFVIVTRCKKITIFQFFTVLKYKLYFISFLSDLELRRLLDTEHIHHMNFVAYY